MIARSVVVLAVCATAAGCLPKELNEKGPIVSFRITRPGGFSTLDETSTMMRIDTSAMKYEFTFILLTRAGEEKRGLDTTYHPVSASGLVATFTVPDVTVPDGTYTADSDTRDNRDYTRNELVTIPGTAMGQNMVIHVEVTDSNGLGSNVLDVTYALIQ